MAPALIRLALIVPDPVRTPPWMFTARLTVTQAGWFATTPPPRLPLLWLAVWSKAVVPLPSLKRQCAISPGSLPVNVPPISLLIWSGVRALLQTDGSAIWPLNTSVALVALAPIVRGTAKLVRENDE